MPDPETARQMKTSIDRGLRDKKAGELHAAKQVFTAGAIPGAGVQRLHLLIIGKVQGVFFRAYVHRTATFLKLTGWVRNRPDGAVEVLAEGPRVALEELIDQCEKGAPLSEVDSVMPEWGRATGEFHAFDIRV